MAETAPNPTLLPSLGRLVRGLSALFWGLPAALVLAVQTVKGEWFKMAGCLPATLAMGLLLYGTHLLGSFQPQERIWRISWERARMIAFVNFGLAPFLFFWSKVSGNTFFYAMIHILVLTSLLYLYLVNSMLARLAAMLPDETLRAETRLFSRMNQLILIVIICALPIYFLLHAFARLPRLLVEPLLWIERGGTVFQFAATLVFILLPLAMTMALIWKTKEVIMSGVFSPPDSTPVS
jgi:hypothetical protein